MLLKNLKVKRSLRKILDDEVDAGFVTPEGVSGHAGEESGVSPLGPLDADRGQDSVSHDLLPDSVPGVHEGVQPLIVHVPEYSNRLLSLGLARQDCGLSLESGLTSRLDLEGRRSWNRS